jgi:hypothetical protein
MASLAGSARSEEAGGTSGGDASIYIYNVNINVYTYMQTHSFPLVVTPQHVAGNMFVPGDTDAPRRGHGTRMNPRSHPYNACHQMATNTTTTTTTTKVEQGCGAYQ